MFFLSLLSCAPESSSSFAVNQPEESEITVVEATLRTLYSATCENPAEQIYSGDQQVLLEQNSSEWWPENAREPLTYAASGVMVGDIDNDGDLDIILARLNAYNVYLNQGNLQFTKTAEIIPPAGYPAGGTLVDIDNDGDLDLQLSIVRGDSFLLFNDNGRFGNEQSLDNSPKYAATSAWFDYDQDGDLDLFLSGYGNDQVQDMLLAIENGTPIPGEANQLYDNQDGRLVLSSNFPIPEQPHFTFFQTWFPTSPFFSLLVGNDFGMLNGPNQMLQYSNTGEFRDIAAELDLDFALYSMGFDFTDLNQDQKPDLVITNIGNPILAISDSQGWYDAALAQGLAATEARTICWGTQWNDINADGLEDLWFGCGPLPMNDESSDIENPSLQPDALFLNEGTTFSDISDVWGVDRATNTRGGLFADLNQDGFWELIRVPIDGEVEIFQAACNDNHWLDVSLIDNQGNRNTIGATIQIEYQNQLHTRWLKSGGNSFLSSASQTVHFGLGEIDVIDKLRIVWPDGSQSIFTDVASNQKIEIER